MPEVMPEMMPTWIAKIIAGALVLVIGVLWRMLWVAQGKLEAWQEKENTQLREEIRKKDIYIEKLGRHADVS